ncbi:MAG: BspA family leucine-rich repeat surface protein, partial [Muribaculaceae bacterium]|nr:BspA family leucine-rich repeat surface protein [Muribaculaceae bacterium]
MKNKTLLFRLFALVAAMMCALGASAIEAYACYTSSNTTLTFYYDNLRSSRTGTTYDLNTGSLYTDWDEDGTKDYVTKVVFHSSFANYRPTTTYDWFFGMHNLRSITGISNLNTSEVTNMAFMFQSCDLLTSIDLSHFNTSKVTDMSGMFANSTGLTSLDLSSFNTSRVTKMRNMFSSCSNLRTIYVGSGWNTASVTASSNMFTNCTSLVGGQGTTYNSSNPTDKTYAHIDGGTSNPGYFSEFKESYACYTPSNTTLTFYYDNQRSSRSGTTYDLNTDDFNTDWEDDGTNASVTKVVFDPSFADARPTTTFDWFFGMQKLQSITGMSYLNTSEVTNMGYMFHNCIKLTSLDLSSFNTSNVTDMFFMFYNCSSLTSLDLSSFNTSQVIEMSCMFENCSNLRTIYVGNGWSTAVVTSSGDMFYNCTRLVGSRGTTYNASNPMNKTYAHIDGGTSNPGYFTAEGEEPWTGPEAYACYTSSNTTLTFYYDNQRSSRPGTTYTLNTGNNYPGWKTDGTNANVTKVVFDPSFAGARPTTTYEWFMHMDNLQSITGMSYLNTSEVTNMAWMFGYCAGLTSLDLRHFNTSKVTNMGEMFYGCSSLTSLDLSSFNTSQVTRMDAMFGCSSLTSLDLSGFNTSQVTNMSQLFYSCSSLTNLDLSSFNTSQVTRMDAMFNRCNNLRTVYVGNGWSTAAVTNSTSMFYGCTSLVGGMGTTYDASHVDKEYAHIDGGTSNPGYFTAEGEEPWTDPEAYACYTSSNTTLTFYYDTQRSSRPGTTYDLNTDYDDTGWETDGTNASVTKVVFDPSFANARPTTTWSWFYDMANLQSITGMSYLNTSEATYMGYMFMNCTNLTSLDLSSFNTSKVTIMGGMFSGCSNLTSIDLSSFNTSQVIDMYNMFYLSENLKTIYVGNGWSTAAVTSSSSMFYGCTSLVGGQGTTYNASNPMDKTYAHIDGGPSNPGYFTAEGEEPWTVPEAYACYTSSNTTLTFYYDTQRSSRPGTTYDLNTGENYTGWETDGTNAEVTKVVFDPSFADARPTSTYDWFYDMTNLQSITGMSYLNTSEVTNMAWMFTNCKKLTSLDVSHFNTAKVTNMVRMFNSCSGLTSLDLSSFNTAKVTTMWYMFGGSNNLRTIYVGNSWSTATVTYSTDMFYNCTSLVGGQGTTWNSSNPKDKTYAHIDGGPSNPGYFTDKNATLRGDVNGDGSVNISDVTALIDYLLSGNPSGVNLTAADCNQDSSVNI